jgi:predicted nucleic acid-binding protein
VASAEKLYVDPSALLKLYLRERESRAMIVWRGRISGPLIVTHHGRVELVNAIALAAHRGLIGDQAYESALAALDDDFAAGRYRQADLLWRATLKRAAELARRHTRSIGCRSLDVLHVASAMELERRQFVTFDARQGALAKATGFQVIVPGV